MIAHDFFMTGRDDPGVLFMPIKAKGKFDSKYIAWSTEDFKRECKKIDKFAEDLMLLVVHLEHASFSVDRLEARPMWLQDSSARARPRSHPDPERADSDPATPNTTGEKPPPVQE
jgi:hypothetical protein